MNPETPCRHGKLCYRYKCIFKHPGGRYIGKDCPDGWSCKNKDCGYHHPKYLQNHPDKQEMINTLRDGTYCPPVQKKIKKNYWWLNDKYGGVHPSKGKNIEHKTHTCSFCKQSGHNSRTCWIKSLPPPPADWL